MTGNRRARLRCFVLCWVTAALAHGAVRADVVLYQIPGTTLLVRLQGRVSVNPGGSVSYTHARFGRLYLRLEDVRIYRAPSPQSAFARRLQAAVRGGDVEDVLDAGRWALRHGLLDKFYEAMEAAEEIDGQHEAVVRVREVREAMARPIGDSSDAGEYLRTMVPRPGMKLEMSDHYILLHDTPDEPGPNRRLPRAQERLELLELVYESFLMRFALEGVDVQVPERRLMVVLFQNHEDFLDYSTRLSPDLASAAGFWNSQTNIAIFFDQATTPAGRAMQQLAAEFNRLKEEALRRRTADRADLVRLAGTMSLLVEIANENADIEVVTHEATHQMAGNTGLLPRHVMVPAWVHEGLATYFESPSDAAWSGIGSVNDQRIEWYRALAGHPLYSSLDFVVSNQIFDLSASQEGTLHAYGQAWALTHFLMESHPEELYRFYRRLGEMPPHLVLNPATIQHLFDDSFEIAPDVLEDEWRSYMRGLRTDTELFLEEFAEGGGIGGLAR